MDFHRRSRARWVVPAAVFSVLLASAQPIHALELSVKNELRADEDGSTLYVEDARSVESPKSRFTAHIQPGKTVKITRGNLQTMMLVRPFSRHKLKYEVSCDAEQAGDVIVTLLDIHNKRLPDGCELSRRGHWSRRTGMNWKAE